MRDRPVNVGVMQLEDAKTLRLCVANCINNGNLWERENRDRATALKAWLDLCIAHAEAPSVQSFVKAHVDSEAS